MYVALCALMNKACAHGDWCKVMHVAVVALVIGARRCMYVALCALMNKACAHGDWCKVMHVQGVCLLHFCDVKKLCSSACL